MSSQKSKAPRVEYVLWVDSSRYGGAAPWTSLDDVLDNSKQPTFIESAGFLLREDKTTLLIAAHISPGQVSGNLLIPKCAIIRRKRLAP